MRADVHSGTQRRVPDDLPLPLLLFLLLLMHRFQRMRTSTATTLIMTMRMILIVLSGQLQSEQVVTVESGQRRTMPLWLLLSEPGKERTQLELQEDQGVLPIIVFTQLE